MTGRRLRALAIPGLAVAAIGGLLIAGRPWWTVLTDGPPVAMSGTTSSGGLATGLALIVAGGIPLLLVLRPLGRRIVAVVQALAAVGMVLAGAMPAVPGDELIRTQLRQHTLANATGVETTGWPIGYLLAGVLGVLAAGLVVYGAGLWPVRGDRFNRRSHDITSDDPHEVWKALDAGVDPTAETTAEDATGPAPDDGVPPVERPTSPS